MMEQEIALRKHGVRMLVMITVVFAAVCIAIGAASGLYPVMPRESISAAIGVNAVIPIVCAFAVLVAGQLKSRPYKDFIRILPYDCMILLCCVLVSYFHFLFKCWVPLINTQNYDFLLHQQELKLLPLKEAIFWIRDAAIGWIPYSGLAYQMLYHTAIIAAYALLARRCSRTYLIFVVASMLCFAIGGYLYLAMPSSGPFVFEQGANSYAAYAQMQMQEWRQDLVQHGAVWANNHIPYMLTGPLGAMPSLHLAIATILCCAMWKTGWTGRLLYGVNFGFLVIESIASRWHYIADIPVGIVFGAMCYYMATCLIGIASKTPDMLLPVEEQSFSGVRT